MGKSQVEEGKENREREHLRYLTVTPRRKWDFPLHYPSFLPHHLSNKGYVASFKKQKSKQTNKKPHRDKEREYFLNTKPLFAVTSLMQVPYLDWQQKSIGLSAANLPIIGGSH